MINKVKRTLLSIWRILSLPCSESTRLMSASLDEQLPWPERAAFRLHAIGCRSCRRFFRQIRFLRAAAEKHSHNLSESGGSDAMALSPEARQRIDEAVRRAMDPDN